jgi:2-oxo-4-hydroxy-4-carboxy-5-ureidoimidazoline decarboxylase
VTTPETDVTIRLDDINAMDRGAFVAALGTIFEQSPWVAEAVYAARPFRTLAALHDAMMAAVRAAHADQCLALVRAHPDLAGKAARAGALTVDSTAEQASAGLDRLSEQEFADFHRLNDGYRSKFDIPFIICVRRHSKDSILRQFERRLENEPTAELETAITEIGRIAALRLSERLSADDSLAVHGRLSTHVLDTHSGRPAVGVAVELSELANAGESRVVARATTNAEGRTDRALIEGRPVPIGRYELRFAVADYFAQQGVALGEPPFLDVVPVRFAVADAEGRYHVPLLVTPWSYATYRGS